MKINFKNVLAIALIMLFTMPLFAQGEDSGTLTASAVIAAFAPIVVWAATQAVRWMVPKIPAMWTVIVVAGLSTLLTFLTTQADLDSSFVMQVVYGLSAIAVNEILKAFGVKKPKTA